MSFNALRFSRKDDLGFFNTLRQRVDSYLEESNSGYNGGYRIIIKSLILISLYVIPFVLILLFDFTGIQRLLLCVIIGIGLAGVGMSVMHDANHGAFSQYKWVNKLFSGSMYLIGGNIFGWRMQHNTLHHSFTNVLHHDQDITGKPFLRLSYEDKLKPYHKYQYLYAPLLYSMMNLAFFVKDFKQVFIFCKDCKTKFRTEFSILIITKIIYFSIFLGLPMLLTDITFLQWILGYLVVQWTGGLIMATIFQLAHIVEGAQFPVTDGKSLENTWAIHQLLTTANFSRNSKIMGWYIGGLNYQIEHHLFPNICHVHYPNIAPIVEATAKEYGIPYIVNNTIFEAIHSHISMLKHLGTVQSQEKQVA